MTNQNSMNRRYQHLRNRSMPATCTQEGVTKSQPGLSVSLMSPSITGKGGVDLHVTRHYDSTGRLRNPHAAPSYGIFRLADYGKHFDSSDEAWAYALDRGYIREFTVSSESRARRVARALNPKEINR